MLKVSSVSWQSVKLLIFLSCSVYVLHVKVLLKVSLSSSQDE